MIIKDIIKKWLFSDEIKRIEELEICYKEQIENCIETARHSARQSDAAKKQYQHTEQLLEDCRKILTQVCDIGIDVGMHDDYHSWAVICMAGKKEYVKFMPLQHEDARRILEFLKTFQYSRQIIDSPLAFQRMIRNEFIKTRF